MESIGSCTRQCVLQKAEWLVKVHNQSRAQAPGNDLHRRWLATPRCAYHSHAWSLSLHSNGSYLWGISSKHTSCHVGPRGTGRGRCFLSSQYSESRHPQSAPLATIYRWEVLMPLVSLETLASTPQALRRVLEKEHCELWFGLSAHPCQHPDLTLMLVTFGIPWCLVVLFLIF